MIPFCISEERERGRGEKEGEDVFRCGSCDEKRGERLKTRSGEERKRREVVEEYALFIPADTSESLIHLEKGISQVKTYPLAVTHRHAWKHRHMMKTHTHIIASDLLEEKRIIIGLARYRGPRQQTVVGPCRSSSSTSLFTFKLPVYISSV